MLDLSARVGGCGAADVDPALLPAGQGLLGGQLQIVGLHGALDGIGCSVYRNLNLLIPELRLAGADLVMHLSRLVAKLQVLLAELEQHQGDQGGREDTNQQLDHGNRD